MKPRLKWSSVTKNWYFVAYKADGSMDWAKSSYFMYVGKDFNKINGLRV